jgi:large subunit ribosomal protein L21
MYAVVRAGGKQYRVSAGDRIRVERIEADVGQEIVLGEVLAVGEGDALTLGTPIVEGASVKARVLAQGRGAKVRIFKLNRRKHYRRTRGHRQDYTEIEILGLAH